MNLLTAYNETVRNIPSQTRGMMTRVFQQAIQCGGSVSWFMAKRLAAITSLPPALILRMSVDAGLSPAVALKEAIRGLVADNDSSVPEEHYKDLAQLFGQPPATGLAA